MARMSRAIKRLLKKALDGPRRIFYAAASRLYYLRGVRNCYLCPICNYYGRFKTVKPETGERKNAQCPQCGALERHRLQYLVFEEITRGIDTKKMKMLHFAPEAFFQNIFRGKFGVYVTADLQSEGVDRREDVTSMSFEDSSFHFIYASHVFEHIKNDLQGLSEIRRVLKPQGIAVIPVPVIGEKTIEYPEPNPHESGHVRCPGEDYYRRYNEYFSKVKIYKSSDFNEKYQLYVYEDRAAWPQTMPLRPPVPGQRHLDMVPVCYK
jgi:SAM-dependent methyltransferase